MTVTKAAVAGLAATMVAVGVARLEALRSPLEIRDHTVGQTPVTVYRLPDSRGPAVVVAHGFAGSRQLMEAWSLTLARAGYQAVSFDFLGHGANPRPLSGDLTRVEGTTQLLVAQTRRVMDFARALPAADSHPVALVGHSMASDIVIRSALAGDGSPPVVAISAFSQAVTAEEPRRLLLVTGEWEGHLRKAALEYLRQIDPQAGEGTLARGPNGVVRRAVVAPNVEHVGVLYSETALQAGLDWLDRAYARVSTAGALTATGGWIALMLLGCVVLAWPLAGLVPARTGQQTAGGLSPRQWLPAALVPALATPLLLSVVEVAFLPVLVADYLALHLLVYGVIGLALLWRAGVRLGAPAWLPLLLILAYGLGGLGLLLDRYVASFMPHGGRMLVIAAIVVGAVPFMVADAQLTEAGRAPLGRRLLVRALFLGSLGLAVALNWEQLFFLVLITPVIVLFYLVYATMAGWVGRRSGEPLAPGVALGLILAWSIGVTFPMVEV